MKLYWHNSCIVHIESWSLEFLVGVLGRSWWLGNSWETAGVLLKHLEFQLVMSEPHGISLTAVLSQHFRAIKKGNVGVALGEFLTRLQDTLGRKVDLGLTGDRGVVHPSLQVRASVLSFRVCSLYCSSQLDLLFLQNTVCAWEQWDFPV